MLSTPIYQERLTYMLKTVEVKVLVTNANYAEMLKPKTEETSWSTVLNENITVNPNMKIK
eukprot:Pgem_evm1s16984